MLGPLEDILAEPAGVRPRRFRHSGRLGHDYNCSWKIEAGWERITEDNDVGFCNRIYFWGSCCEAILSKVEGLLAGLWRGGAIATQLYNKSARVENSGEAAKNTTPSTHIRIRPHGSLVRKEIKPSPWRTNGI